MSAFKKQEEYSMRQTLREMWKSGEYTAEEAAEDTGFTVEYCRAMYLKWAEIEDEMQDQSREEEQRFSKNRGA